MAAKKLPDIVREKVWVDPKIARPDYRHGQNYLEYKLYKSKDGPEKAITRRYICLSQFGGYIKPEHDRFLLTIQIYKESQDKYSRNKTWDKVIGGPLTVEQCSRWITLCKEHKLLPPDVPSDTIKPMEEHETDTIEGHEKVVAKGCMELDISDMTASQFYLYISSFRQMREEPGFIRIMLHLVDECKMNFYAAYVFAGNFATGLISHHPIKFIRWPGKTDIEGGTAIMGWAVQLRKFAHDPHKYDNLKIHDCAYFNTQEVIHSVPGVSGSFHFNEFFDEDIVKA